MILWGQGIKNIEGGGYQGTLQLESDKKLCSKIWLENNFTNWNRIKHLVSLQGVGGVRYFAWSKPLKYFILVYGTIIWVVMYFWRGHRENPFKHTWGITGFAKYYINLYTRLYLEIYHAIIFEGIQNDTQ